MADNAAEPVPTPRASADAHHTQQRLARLRQNRVFASREESLAFLKAAFKQGVARPFRQLEGVVAAWEQLVPEALRRRIRLESLQRGVLTVTVDSSATHFVFDEHVRAGLAVKISQLSKGPMLRKIRLRVDASAFAAEAQAIPPDAASGRGAKIDPAQDFDPELPRQGLGRKG